MLLNRKIPKKGSVVRVYVSKHKNESIVYLGSVQETNKSSFVLGGVYENTSPLKACQQSGKFVPLQQELLSFPRPQIPLDAHRWEKVPANPTKTGQYFVYVDQAPVSFTILSMAELTQKPSAQNLMCLIGGTHSFYAIDFADVQKKLDAGELRAFPDYTDAIYTDTLALLRESMRSKVLKAVGGGLHGLPSDPQAIELKL